MNLLEKKSGQATLIIIMVTLAAVVGVAATSSTQSSFSLRNTVYGVQGEQALACAEAGAEKMLGRYNDDDSSISGGSFLDEGTLSGSECRYETTIYNYPDNSGNFIVPRLNENTVIQFNISRDISGARLTKLTPLNEVGGDTAGQIAFYVYNDNMDLPKVDRKMIHCGNTSAPEDFENANFNNGDKSCSNVDLGSLESLDEGSTVRIRALNNDFKLEFGGFTNGGTGVPVGHYIESIGKSGSVERKISVYRFYRQLPDFFDEAIAVLD